MSAFGGKADMTFCVFAVAIGGKAEITFCGAFRVPLGLNDRIVKVQTTLVASPRNQICAANFQTRRCSLFCRRGRD